MRQPRYQICVFRGLCTWIILGNSRNYQDINPFNAKPIFTFFFFFFFLYIYIYIYIIATSGFMLDKCGVF